MQRREFLKSVPAGIAASIALGAGCNSKPNGAVSGPLPTRKLGHTGRDVTILGLGGQAALERPDKQALAEKIIQRAFELGIRYFDTAAAYGGGCSQKYLGNVLPTHRNEVFLASKTNRRTSDGALAQLEESLNLLKTDHLDLWQIHNLQRMEQVDQITAKGGAIEALVRAREQGLVRHLGLTGHADPAVLAEAMRRFQFDTALLAINAADKHYLSFIDNVLPLAAQQNLGVIAMKVAGNGRLVFNWKRLLKFQNPGNLTMRDAIGYVLTLPVSTAIIGCYSPADVEANVEHIRHFSPLSAEAMKKLEDKTRPIMRQALYFRNWGDGGSENG